MGSLNLRLLVAATVVLAAFLGLAGLALEQAFREGALESVRERLKTQVYMLLGAAEMGEGGEIELPERLPEPRFATPGSGLYATVVDAQGGIRWRSPSLLGMSLDFPAMPPPGRFVFRELPGAGMGAHFGLAFSVSWELDSGKDRRLTFRVAESRSGFDAQVGRFRTSLWGWFVSVAMLLLLVQALILRWGLRPLRQVARELGEIEEGRRSRLSESYPSELRRLTANLNTLVAHSSQHLERYRNALADLAHSLKTPLAILRAAAADAGMAADAGTARLRETVQEQVARMNNAVGYQLQRAAASGRVAMLRPVAVDAVARKVFDGLAKVYAERGLRFRADIPPGTRFFGDEGDLYEILGNLGDNACKWARSELRVQVQAPAGDGPARRLAIRVDDDGPGVPRAVRRRLVDRGARGDPSVEGQGIGLAVVRDVAENVYGGRLEIGESPLGGASVTVVLDSE